ncbi:MAG: methionyl-tRNA formyltransferase [Lachnospiraceae bacterium]
MRIIFMGTPEFSVGTLEALITAGHEVVLAVTQPDKPRGRKQEIQYPPVKEAALKHGIPVYQPVKIRNPKCIEELEQYHAEIMVVIAFGQILPQTILDLTPYGCINVHASLLPKYRGAAPIQWAIIHGETVTGVTTMQMDAGLDTGDMIMKTEVPLDEKETGGSLHDKLMTAGAELCVKTLKALEEKTAVFEKQGESPTDYARMLDKQLGDIRWGESAAAIERLIRGLNPWPGAYTNWNGKTMKIWDAEVQQADTNQEPGTVTAVGKDEFLVQTGNGQLRITGLQIPGKKRMDAGAFLRGYPLEAGTILKGGN